MHSDDKTEGYMVSVRLLLTEPADHCTRNVFVAILFGFLP